MSSRQSRAGHNFFHATVAGRGAVRLAAQAVLFVLLTAHCPPLTSFAQYAQPPQRGESSALPPQALKNIGIEQRQGHQLPLDARFRDEAGREVRLGDYFGRQRPVVVAPVYYDCPMLCNQVLHGLVGGLRGQPLVLGKDFDVVAVSFDAREGAESAFNKEQVVLSELRRKDDPVAAAGLHFLTGERAEIDAVMDALGFGYAFDERTNQFAHAAGVMVATPEGRLSHYFYGIEYAPRDLKLALVESSGGKLGSAVDKLILYCYHYDPTTGKYGPAIMNAMRVGGVVTVLGVVALILILRRTRARRATAAAARAAAPRGGARGRRAPWRRPPRGEPLKRMDWLRRILFTPEQASTVATEWDALYAYIVAITVFFTVLVVVLIFFFAVKYRRRDDAEIPRPNAGSMKLETMWTVVPFVIAMTIFAWGAYLYFRLYRQPANAIEVFVVGKQWMWKFQHTEGQREINELHVPVGSKVKLTMTTEDVIHALAVPAFRIRSDVVPGRYTYAWFEATKPGRYPLFCTEYCGTNHSGMIGWVEVMDPADYQAWLSGGGTESPAAQGEKLFQSIGCATCHQAETQGRGPVLTGLYGRQQQLADGSSVTVDEDYIRESIVNPQAKTAAGFQQIMPTYQGQVSEEQLLQLLAYIRSLGAPQGGAAAPRGAATAPEGSTTREGVNPDAQRSNPVGSTQPQNMQGAPRSPAGQSPAGQAGRGGGNSNR